MNIRSLLLLGAGFTVGLTAAGPGHADRPMTRSLFGENSPTLSAPYRPGYVYRPEVRQRAQRNYERYYRRPGQDWRSRYQRFFGYDRDYDYDRRYRGEVPDDLVVEDPRNWSTVRPSALPPEKRVVLHAKETLEAPAEGSLAVAIHSQLTEPANDALTVRKAHLKPIIDFYAKRGFKPAWTSDAGLTKPARRALAVMVTASDDGLTPEDYLPASLSGFDDGGESLAGTPGALARLDLEMTSAALDYVRHITAGAVDPFRVSKLHTIEVDEVDPAQALQRLTADERPDSYLTSLQPKLEQYQVLKQALAKAKAEAGGAEVTQIPAGRTIRPGDADARLALVEKRLATLGHLDKTDTTDGAAFAEAAARPVYDETLVEAVRRFQKQAGLKVDGIIGRNTLGALNGRSSAERIKALTLNLERLRWLPRELAAKHVFVNQAFFTSWMMDGDREIYRTDVVVGKPKYQTAVFNDEMESVVFNPYWNVPRSIAVNEMLPKLAYDPYHLADRGFEARSASGQTVDWGMIDWWGYDEKTLPYDFRQRPGPTNALGRVKFLFPNKHAIYMHDTPQRHLFKRTSRAFSHGCIRLEKPIEFARVILQSEGWTAEEVNAAVARGENLEVKLNKKIAVYVGYYTAWGAQPDQVRYAADVYGRDRVLAQAFEQNRAASGVGKIASN